jgi:hypothetical protein
MKQYHTAYRRNGTEDEILICRPNGDYLSFIQFWDEPDTNDAAIAEATARHIVDALNAYKKPLRLPRRKMAESDDTDDFSPWQDENAA